MVILKKKELEMILQKLRPIPDPDPSLEQYQTPSDIGADLLFQAYSRGDIAGKKIVEPGCGNGLLLLGAGLLGAVSLTGFDTDSEAVGVAEDNLLSLSVAGFNQNARFFQAALPAFQTEERFDTAVMNPPFGAQKKGADRPFLSFALTHAETVYSLHLFNTGEFVVRFIEGLGGKAEILGSYTFPIRHTFSFHTREKKVFQVALIRAESG